MTPVTTTPNTKTAFQKTPCGVMKTRTFIVLATLLLIGQVLVRPAAAQTGAAEDCTKISDEPQRTACWLKKAKAGEKDLRNSLLNGVDLSKAKLSKTDLSGARLRGADLRSAMLTGANLICSRESSQQQIAGRTPFSWVTAHPIQIARNLVCHPSN